MIRYGASHAATETGELACGIKPHPNAPITEVSREPKDATCRSCRSQLDKGRHTAVSIMSSNGVPIQEISDTVGHKSTHVTETVYRHVIVPEIRGGATVMDDIFGDDD